MDSEHAAEEPIRDLSTTALLKLRASGLEWRQVEGEVVALDVHQDQYLYLNRTGAVLWAALASGATREELASLLEERFNVDHERALGDVDALIARLREQSLLEPS